MRQGGPERVVIQGVIEKIHRRPSVDLFTVARHSSADNAPRVSSDLCANGWVEDASVDRCMVCATMFSLFSRRHHCRACGNVVCKMCSPNTATIAELPLEGYQRVCTQCFWGQDLVYMSNNTADVVSSLTSQVVSTPSSIVFPSVEAIPPADAQDPVVRDTTEVTRRISNSSISSTHSRGSDCKPVQTSSVWPQKEVGSLLPIPLFAAKLKRVDGSKVFVNICTNDSLLPTETIVCKHVVPDKNTEMICYDYVIHSERAVVYTLLVPDGNSTADQVSDEILAAKNEIVYDAVKLISLKYGNLSLTGIEPTFPETRNNHKGKIHPFQRSPSKIPRHVTTDGSTTPKWAGESYSFISSLAADDISGSVEPPPLRKGWVTILGAGGKGLIGIGNKKRFVVLDAGLFSVYKKESDTPPFGHHKKDSLVLDGAVIVDDDHNKTSSFSRRKSTSTDVSDAQKKVAHVSRRGSLFGVKKEVEARRLFINSPHNGKRVDVECDSAEDRMQWSLALVQHSAYADFRITQPTLVTESLVDGPHSDDTSVVSEADARNSIHSSVTGVVKAVRRGTIQPTTWAAYSPYMQDRESVLEAGEVSMRVGLLGRYGTPSDLVLTNRGRLYLIDMDARDVDKEIDLIVNRPHGSRVCAKASGDKVFEVVAGNTTYHFKDVTGFKIDKWVTEINTVVNELLVL